MEIQPLRLVNDAGIVAKLEEFLQDYLVMPQPYYHLPLALWALATHCYDKFDAFPYVIATSTMPGAGKSRLLEVLRNLSHQALMVPKITLAGMCSALEEGYVTLMIDQAERLGREQHNDLMACILAGYRKDMPVVIQQGGRARVRPIFGPKGFSLIGDMVEAAKDRSIVVEMSPKRAHRRWLSTEARERGETLQKRITQLMEERGDDIDDALANLEGLLFLMEREEEIWTPLFVIAEVFCPDRRAELESAAANICAVTRAEPRKIAVSEAKLHSKALRDGERALMDLLRICGPTGIRTSEALRGLKAMHAAPWHNYAGIGLTDIKLADLLRPYSVGPKQFKVEGKNLRGYRRDEIEAAYAKIDSPIEKPKVVRPQPGESSG